MFLVCHMSYFNPVCGPLPHCCTLHSKAPVKFYQTQKAGIYLVHFANWQSFGECFFIKGSAWSQQLPCYHDNMTCLV